MSTEDTEINSTTPESPPTDYPSVAEDISHLYTADPDFEAPPAPTDYETAPGNKKVILAESGYRKGQLNPENRYGSALSEEVAKRYPIKTRNNTRQKTPYAYEPLHRNSRILIPHWARIAKLEQAMEFVDQGHPFRECSDWLNAACAKLKHLPDNTHKTKTVTHTGLRNIWLVDPAYGANPKNKRAKEMRRLARQRKKGRTPTEQKEYELKMKQRSAKRALKASENRIRKLKEKREQEQKAQEQRQEEEKQKELLELVRATLSEEPEKQASSTPARSYTSYTYEDARNDAKMKASKAFSRSASDLSPELVEQYYQIGKLERDLQHQGFEVLIKPNPGPQTDFLAASEREVLYGGSAGGGKTFALIMDPMRYFHNGNFNGLILRRTTDELREIVWKTQELYPQLFPGAKWQEKKSQWVFPSGARLWLTYLERDEDVLRYQGQAFCVAVGTPVLMADGTYKAVERLQPGEMVATLEGPQPLLWVSKRLRKKCVKVTSYDAEGHLIGEQLHPYTHPIGLLSSTPYSQFSDLCHNVEQFRSSPLQWISAERLESLHRENRGTYASVASDQTDCRGSEDVPQEGMPPRGWFFPAMLHVPDPQSDSYRASTQSRTSDKSSGQLEGTCQENLESSKGLSYLGKLYSHPYTQEQRQLTVPVSVGIVHVCPIEITPEIEVVDLTVNSSNHYITSTGIINQNCYIAFDEITQYSTPFAWNYMRSRLRTTDPTLPLCMRATTNPGGPGHLWVKRGFIDPAPPNTAFGAVDFETGEPLVYPKGHDKEGEPLYSRKFIPATLYDNPYLMQDGQYEANLMSLPYHQRKALLEGDWNITEGAAFPEFSIKVHTCDPFDVPKSWTRFAAADYGYASPSACYWFAIDPVYETLYVYRELYDSGLTGKDLAQRVHDIEIQEDDSVYYRVLDSSVWHKRGQTGPSIAEEMQRICRWRPSDRSSGSRVARKNRLHELLKVDEFTEMPGIIFFNTCRQIIADLQVIPVDPKGTEDIDPRYKNDHSYDAIGYGIMSRPRNRMDQLWGADRAKVVHKPADPVFGY